MRSRSWWELSREPKPRQAANPAEPLPEIHIAPDVPTVLLFPADIQKKTITVDRVDENKRGWTVNPSNPAFFLCF